MSRQRPYLLAIVVAALVLVAGAYLFQRANKASEPRRHETLYVFYLVSDYLPAYRLQHGRWPTSLSALPKFYQEAGIRSPGKYDAILKVHRDSRPVLLPIVATETQYEFVIVFYGEPTRAEWVTTELQKERADANWPKLPKLPEATLK